ncbi:MAG: cytidylate kinase-like family protein [Ruminococcus sp.]|nr:cytidylate kinase-like family protein [Ruminococcus sp.]MDE6848604.1 cytidylate kinase-like family protein [Ruminococcus sp.]
MEQLIISVGREFGSGGRVIAEALAERFGIPIYDRHLITEIADKTGLTPEQIEKYNENPKKRIISRRVRGYSNSIEDNIAEMQFDFLKEKSESGESFVVVGRCSETKLKSNPALVSLFILADMDAKVKRVMEIYELSKEDAEDFIFKKDKKRKRYHNYHCSGHWGDSRLYDICINSSCLGIEKTVDYLESYIRARKDI